MQAYTSRLQHKDYLKVLNRVSIAETNIMKQKAKNVKSKTMELLKGLEYS